MTRIRSLDGLRAASILFVFLGHLYGTTGYPKNVATRVLGAYAHFGVVVFFVISGFLITTLLLKERERHGRIALLDFYRRRTLRIIPAAFVYTTVVAYFTVPRHYLLYAYTYTICYADHGRPWLVGHLWSLSVEEQFYLLWPFAVALGFAWRRQIAVGVILLAPLARLLFWINGHRSIGEYFPAVSDSLAAGCLLACVRPYLQARARWLAHPLVFAAMVAMALSTPLLHLRVRTEMFVGGLIPLLLALCIFAAIERGDWFLNNAVTARIGVLSYSLYLWQQPFLNRNVAHWWTTFPQNVVLAAAAALASYFLVEKPFLRWKERLDHVPVEPATQVVAAVPSLPVG